MMYASKLLIFHGTNSQIPRNIQKSFCRAQSQHVLLKGRMKTAAGWSVDFQHFGKSCARCSAQFNKNEPSAEDAAGGRGGSLDLIGCIMLHPILGSNGPHLVLNGKMLENPQIEMTSTQTGGQFQFGGVTFAGVLYTKAHILSLGPTMGHEMS